MKYITWIMLLAANSVFAGYNGEINFTQEQITEHKRKAVNLSLIAERCLQRYKSEHESYYRSHCWRNRRGGKTCLSKYYGDRRYTTKQGSKRSDGKTLEFLPEALRAFGINPAYANQMESISCVGLALNCLGEGFKQTGQSEEWSQIRKFVSNNGVGGTALQHALSQIGWKTYYWNPAPYWSIDADTQRWDAEERNWQSKGYHSYRLNNVRNRGTYWFNKVDNQTDLVGFGDSVPRILRKFPFWVGTANTGYHVFPGTREKVVEAHSTRHFTAFDNLEFSNFSPFATGGGPRWTNNEKYRSGLIVFPPM